VIIFPDAGPDMKYFFGFVRTQLGTSVTIMLIFGPKAGACLMYARSFITR
jgi:hypothetical protein